MMVRLGTWYEQGRIKLRTSHRFPLEQFQEAMRVVLGRESIGRVALDICTETNESPE